MNFTIIETEDFLVDSVGGVLHAWNIIPHEVGLQLKRLWSLE